MQSQNALFENALSIEKLETRFEMEDVDAPGSCTGSCPIVIKPVFPIQF
jgi:hypothetical protein